MNITDGAIMFIGCVLSFSIGYAIGAIRVGRYVNKRLEDILGSMKTIERASGELSQYYAKLGEEDNK